MQRYFDIGGGNEDRALHIEQERSNLRDTLTQNDTARLTSQLALNRANCSCDSRRLRDCLLIPSLSHPFRHLLFTYAKLRLFPISSLNNQWISFKREFLVSLFYPTKFAQKNSAKRSSIDESLPPSPPRADDKRVYMEGVERNGLKLF